MRLFSPTGRTRPRAFAYQPRYGASGGQAAPLRLRRSHRRPPVRPLVVLLLLLGAVCYVYFMR